MTSGRLIGTGAALALGGALVLAGCGGGGGGGGSDVTFSFASSAATLAEDAGATSVTVVLHTTLPALLLDASVDVVDLGSGTADSGFDYAAFAPVTLTFPAGSVEGASQTVALDPLDDLLVEAGSETVRLRLQNASGGAVSGTTQFTLTITDIHSASVAFATGSSSTPDEASGAHVVALELECGAGVSLDVAASVRVSDLRTGTAVPPGDYASFSARTLTFPAGSADGALQTFNVNVVDDANMEADETIELGLSTPSSTCTLGVPQTHVLSITDDDAAGPAAFAGSEGVAGTGNPLAYDEVLPLGTQSVGAGPNAGTLVRVTNAGGASMELGAPRVTGSHLNDFAVDIESSALPPEDLARLPVAGMPAPLAVLADGGPGVALRLEPVELARLGTLGAVALHDVPLPELGSVTLELRRLALPLTDDARLVVDGVDVPGGPRTLLGDLQLWSGGVAGMEGSRVFLALTPGGAQGFVRVPGTQAGTVHVFADGPGRLRLLNEPQLAALGLEPPQDFCAGERYVPGAALRAELGDPQGPGTSALTIANCRLALESDYQLYQKFNSSTLLTNYVTSLIGAISDQYTTDVQATLSIAYLGVHTNSNDGWDTQDTPGGNASNLLDEFKTKWGSNWPAQADLAHFLSGDGLGGGIAYVNVLCSPSFGYGVSGNMTGTINWLTWTGASAGFTWDFVVVAHELGHNFGSQHTHSYCPPLDQCYTNCNGVTACTRGTLMSYCHVSCGGLANIDLYFHPVCANLMRNAVNASCLEDALLAPGDFVQYRVRFNPLTATGARSAALEFQHDASNVTQPFRVQLTGTATN